VLVGVAGKCYCVIVNELASPTLLLTDTDHCFFVGGRGAGGGGAEWSFIVRVSFQESLLLPWLA